MGLGAFENRVLRKIFGGKQGESDRILEKITQ
jgi:hypothetical protein